MPLGPRADDSAVPRAQQIKQFLRDTPWQKAAQAPLTPDASLRRYTRLTMATTGANASAMLMDAPPSEKPVGEFDRIAKHLHRLGIVAPQTLLIDADKGLLLLQDLGDLTFTRALQQGDSETRLYEMAVDVLIKLHTAPQAAAIKLPRYDQATLNAEAALLTDWFFPYCSDQQLSQDQRSAYFAGWETVFAALPAAPPTLVLRDYHIDNLMVIESKDRGQSQCAVLDFQDALLGHAAYDLVSLLQDARRDIPKALAAQMLARYFKARPDIDQASFMAWYHALGAQRHCKVLGIFVRLYERDGKPNYLKHLPRVKRYLQYCLRDPALDNMAAWFQQHLDLDKLNLKPIKKT